MVVVGILDGELFVALIVAQAIAFDQALIDSLIRVLILASVAAR